jgi:hypothetical protein
MRYKLHPILPAAAHARPSLRCCLPPGRERQAPFLHRLCCPTPPPHIAALPGGAHPAFAAAEPIQVDQPHLAAAGAAPADAKGEDGISSLRRARGGSGTVSSAAGSLRFIPPPPGVWCSLQSAELEATSHALLY